VQIHVVNPLSDCRWDDLVARHPKASAFHQRGWLESLARTYSYQPFVLTSAPPGEQLADGIVFCGVSSWITGTRSVSLPFADHCEPLLNEPASLRYFVEWLHAECDRQPWRYVELRPRSAVDDADCSLRPSASYCFHELDISACLEKVFCGLHRNSIQRRIQRAENEGLSYEVGRSAQLVGEFYRLQLITRRRHRLLPQPFAWFGNLVECMRDGIEIRLARKNAIPIGAMLSLRHGATVVYKYGCSDPKFHHFGAMPFLFWRLIEESKARGAEKIDLGRSDLHNPGLIVFKDRLGASRQPLTYYRYLNPRTGKGASRWDTRTLRQLFSILPDAAFAAAGRLLYRHMG